jgi:hypothetical protein
MTPAARQLAALLWLLTFVLVAFAWHAGTPLDASALQPRLEQAHSLAAETAMLADLATQRRLPVPVRERQAQQLLGHVRKTSRDLAHVRLREELRGIRDAARAPLLAVERALEQLEAGQPADAAALARSVAVLQAQALALDRMAR